LNAIEVEGLTKRYGDFIAVNDLAFEVKEGEVFGFLGPNGAGKTTTIRMLTGLTAPTSGTARIRGNDIQSEPFLAKEAFGTVPEVSNVYDDLSAWNNLMFAGELYGMPRGKRAERAEALLERAGLTSFMNRKAKGFSKGMKRKLTIAMAMVNDPLVLFLDEPSSGLDVQSALELQKALREMNSAGTTIFLTTHNIEDANIMCDRVAILVGGRLAAVDSPERLKATIQGTQSVRVAFGGNGTDIEDALAKIPTVSRVTREGDKWRLYTDEPTVVLDGVFRYAQGNQLELLSVNTMGPSLEDIFLRLVGGKPR